MSSKALGGMVGILLVTLACGLINPAPVPTPASQAGVETIVAATIQAFTGATPTTGNVATAAAATATEAAPVQVSGIPVSFQNVSFVIPEGLATGANPEAIAAVGEGGGAPWDVAPAHSKFTLVGYPLQGKFFEPYIVIYPAAEFEAVNSGAAATLQQLRTVLANPSAPLTKDVIPGVPGFNAAMIFAANMKLLDTQDLSGVRALTEYAQYSAPVNNYEMIYQFQGLTKDGKYYVIAILPANAPSLASDDNPAAALPAGGVPYPDFGTADEAAFNAYYQSVTDVLDATPPETFTPPLSQLDALMQSIKVTP